MPMTPEQHGQHMDNVKQVLSQVIQMLQGLLQEEGAEQQAEGQGLREKLQAVAGEGQE